MASPAPLRPGLTARVLLLAALVASAGCTPSEPRDTMSPAATPLIDDATAPRDVLAVFLKTLVVGDCSAARQLSTESGFSQVGGFCSRIHVVDFEIVGDGSARGEAAVTYATSLRTEGGNDVLPDGTHTIFFTLERQVSGAWRVTGGGSGP